MGDHRKIDHERISEIAQSVGGWERLLSPEYEFTEDLFVQFEAAGIPREYLQGWRRTSMLSARDKIIKQKSLSIYVQSRPAVIFRDFKTVNFEHLSIDKLLKAFQPDDRMLELGISVDDIKQELSNRFPNAFDSEPKKRGTIRLTKKAKE